jgi:hypothetical protein
MRFLLPAALAAALLTGMSPASGFEINGYRSGMSLAEVQRLTGPLTRLPNSMAYVMITPLPGLLAPSFSFCDDKLFMFGLTLDGGFPTFSAVLEYESTRRGKGDYASLNVEGRNQLTVLWSESDATTMALNLFSWSTSPNLVVTQAWSALEVVKACSH